MSDPIERIPSIRKPSRQGVPKRPKREMAKPMAEGGKTTDAPAIAPRSHAPNLPAEAQLIEASPAEQEIPVDPTLAAELQLAAQPVFEPISPPVPVIEPEPEPEPEPPPVPEPEPVTHPEQAADAQTWPASAGSVPEPEAPAVRPRATMRQLLERVDAAFAEFRAAAYRYPAEHMTDRLTDDGWTRKQMLAHIAAWHDLTAERLTKFALSGQPVPLGREVDAVNAQAARVAIGKSVGEVLKDTEMTMGRLRRQVLRMTDDQMHAEDDWAMNMVASNTYAHYPEHMADLVPPEPLPGTGSRR